MTAVENDRTLVERPDRTADATDAGDHDGRVDHVDHVRERRSERLWFVITLVAVVVAAMLPLLFFRRYYFVDDTESGAFGVWWKIGTDLRSGTGIQIFDPHAWMSGNYVAEGQWGFWNPFVLLVSLLASLTRNAVLFCTVLKVFLLVVGSTGVFALSRSYRVVPPLAAVAGVGTALGGFTLYMDATSWVTALMVWAAMPWLWVSLRRLVHGGRNPAATLVWAYLIVTVGYVYGAISLVFVLLGVGLGPLARRQWRQVARVLGVAAIGAALTLVVYLPGVLTSSVTQRNATGILNTEFMSVPLSGIAMGAQPAGLPYMPGFWGAFSPTPVLYIAWFLPLVALVDFRRARTALRPALDVVITTVLFAALMLGPDQIGPLRFPARLVPSFVLGVLVLFVVLLSHARAAALTRTRVLAAIGLSVGSAYLSWSETPASLRPLALTAALAIAGIIAVWWLLGLSAHRPTRVRLPGVDAARHRPVAAAAVVLVAGSVVFTGLQHHSYPRAAINTYGMPTDPADYRDQAAGSVNDGIVVGEGYSWYPDPRRWSEMLVGNSWYLNQHTYQNTYTPVGYANYASLICMNFLGETCPELGGRLFDERPSGMLLADEIGVDTVLFVKSRVSSAVWSNPQPGWSLRTNGVYTAIWTRDVPRGPSGGVVHTSEGVSASTRSQTDRSVTIHVDAVPAGGGTVAVSRLDWPGYAVDGSASITDPMDGFLLQVRVSAASAGQDVTLTFTPPGYHLGWVLWTASLIGGVAWVGVALVRRRRRAGGTWPADAGQTAPAGAGGYDRAS